MREAVDSLRLAQDPVPAAGLDPAALRSGAGGTRSGPTNAHGGGAVDVTAMAVYRACRAL